MTWWDWVGSWDIEINPNLYQEIICVKPEYLRLKVKRNCYTTVSKANLARPTEYRIVEYR